MRCHSIYHNILPVVASMIFFFVPAGALPQTDAHYRNIKTEIATMHRLLQSEPDRGYAELLRLLTVSRDNGLKDSELVLLSNKCWYFLLKADFDKVIATAYELEEKSIEYKSINFQGVAIIYRCQIYIENDLKEKALSEYSKALKVLEKGDPLDERIISSKANAHTYIANLYYSNHQIREAANMMALARKQILLHKDKEKLNSDLYRNYSNTGTVYERQNADSALYYINKSLAIAPVHKGSKDFILFLNYSVLGDIYLRKKDYNQALGFYNSAEKAIPTGSDLKNQQSLYEAMVKTYKNLGDSTAVKEYRNRLNEVKLKIANSKYKSLHSVVKETGKQTKKNTLIYGTVIAVTLGLCLVFVFLYIKKSRILDKQEKVSLQYLNEPKPQNENREQVNKKLVALCSGNHPDFMTEFCNAFPHFREKLIVANNNIVESEIEFCAYLKLNLTTKDIARIKNLEPKTIQNRKYRIRKKLNISNDTDIYFYFSLF